MKFDILHLDRFSAGCPSGTLEHDLVVQTQSQLWHARKVTFHLDCTQDFGTNDVAICVDEEIDGFDDIQEDFILPVPYTV